MDTSKKKAAEVKVRAEVIRRAHFGHRHMVIKNTFIFKNVVSYWGSLKLYQHGYQVKLAWDLVDLPRWLQDYVLFHEMMHMEDTGRCYGNMHTNLFWQKLREVFPPTDQAEQALKELKRSNPAESKEWKMKWWESPVRYMLTSKKPAAKKSLSLSAKYGADPTAAYQKFQDELAEKYGW